MPLSEEEKERIKEIEEIRMEVAQEFGMKRGYPPFADPVVGNCQGCQKPLRMGWRFCPYCGTDARLMCSRCHLPLPTEEGVQFCPHCGGKV